MAQTRSPSLLLLLLLLLAALAIVLQPSNAKTAEEIAELREKILYAELFVPSSINLSAYPQLERFERESLRYYNLGLRNGPLAAPRFIFYDVHDVPVYRLQLPLDVTARQLHETLEMFGIH